MDNSINSVYEKLKNKTTSLAVVGLGYVGMPIAVAFAEKGLDVIGFDNNEKKIALYKSGIDPTKEVGDDVIKKTTLHFTSDPSELKKASFIIIAVPTPVNLDHTPDLSPVEGASRIVGRNLSSGTIVVYESTVYPGVTEDVCVPILEEQSGLKCGVDFSIGYSPERINPGDKEHRLSNIKKIVSGMDAETCDQIADVYNLVIDVGTYPVSSIKTAEAIKVVENSQRDINIAFMNELAMVFDRMGIDTNEVVDGMNTKWNALGFRPGLVGGHCIGVDPYYFTYEAERLGYHSQIILNGRMVNDSMGSYIADKAVKLMVEAGQAPKKSRVAILGLTFKENCPDVRNSKVVDIIRRLQEYGIEPIVSDPWADVAEAEREYGIELTPWDDVRDADCLIIAVAHREYREIGMDGLKERYSDDEDNVLLDVKGIYGITELENSGLKYWRL
ncbi:MAG: nucleotide sugar dehydrogenase [Lachnospiraceae bacterium]|nr:nucleotide sugar dehydrogenase [Lachnospiraceae bacterium]